MSNERRAIVHPNKTELAQAVAAHFLSKVPHIIEEFDEATVVLTGGTMGQAVLAAINKSPQRDAVDWSRVNFWWGDERWLPAGDPERNDAQARAALLDHIPVNPARIHAVAASDSGLSLDDAAQAYANDLRAHAARNGRYPNFDIVFLGVGPDGHIASLFPEREGIREQERTVIAVRNSPKPPDERVSLTLPVINSSVRIWAVVAGADKASALGLTLAGASYNEVPAAGLEGRRKTLFLVDQEAAAQVPASLIDPGQFWTSADSTDEH
ncbi:6-phosphogluconolactonase [Salinibacterium sp. UTAS2018]|uniref:6-phosphogluconolactonase n=1 Tax=unclassified Salinibacterium TaxID=2632331 RepID=UPI0010094E23|nr:MULTISPECIES: 6-phosphogluconolactonase [unclassified Salinibacterium]MBH0009339.1 6-phosphogluconolactonase [Salinibacterium sp. SWN1162]QAV69444.1 6-phosphogluconolactonase [Salinibacterium sp. UTAS2018]